jgi:tellurite methyltransferase
MTGQSPSPSPIRKAQDYAAVRDWPGYYRAVAGKGARETLLKALALFDAEPATERKAMDIGCGSGRDTTELLRRGWSVIATDSSADAFPLLKAPLDAESLARVECRVESFETMRFEPCDLINASYALPFCEPRHFARVWSGIVDALPRGARFAGQLFGERDDWARLPDRSHHTRPQAERLLDAFILESFSEEERGETDPAATPKNWHIFHIVARKR